jgi:hypothetical protein
VVETVTQIPQTVTETVTKSVDTFPSAIESVKSSATGLTLYWFHSSNTNTITGNDPTFSRIVDYFSRSKLDKTVKKQAISVTAGQTKTVEVTWL